MMRSLFAAISGLRVHQELLDVTANNIANVNTVGFKSERVSFKDALSQMQQGSGAPVTTGGSTSGGTNAMQVGLGVQLSSIDNVVNPGAIQSTGNPFDLAVQGDGWFQVAQSVTDTTTDAVAGPFFYTRAGNFSRDANGYLVNPEGFYLVACTDPANPATTQVAVKVPPTATSVSIAPSGLVTVEDASNPPDRTIVLAKFANEAGLVRASGNRFAEPAGGNAGTAELDVPGNGGRGSLSAGAVEMSNVDLAQEFTNMITAQRGFQANGRVITATDEVLQELVNLKR